jgi:hypothetical protein
MRVSERAPEKGAVKFAARALPDVVRVEAKATHPCIVPTVERVRDSFRVTVTPVAFGERREYQSKVTLTPFDRDGKALPTADIHVRYDLVGDIQSVPNAIHFGHQYPGKRCWETVTLQSVTGRDFEVVGIRALGNGLSVAPVLGKGLVSYEIVQFCHEGVGEFQGRIEFDVKTSSDVAEVLTLGPVDG